MALLCASRPPGAAGAAAPKRQHERVAVIDLGPDDGGAIPKELATAVVAAGFDAVIGDGIEDALAGRSVDKDAVTLAAVMSEAQRAFGAFDCAGVRSVTPAAIHIGAKRQAAGLPVPELPRALTYMLLCLDKAGDADAAMQYALWLRAVGGSGDVPADVWRKYPDVDTIVDREHVTVEIATDVANANVFVDFKPVGKAPLTIALSAGEHLIAVAAGTKRGWASGTAVPSQPQITIPTTDVAGDHAAIATRVASWKGKLPSPDELAWAMGVARARVVLIRRGDRVEAWGRVGRSEAPHLLGGEDGVASASDPDDRKRLLALVADRVQTWNDRAPDPDQPLLVEKPGDGLRRRKEEPAKWWVYAALAGAVLGAAAIIYVNDAGTDRQRVELTFP